jgi:hypothetical protein
MAWEYVQYPMGNVPNQLLFPADMYNAVFLSIYPTIHDFSYNLTCL